MHPHPEPLLDQLVRPPRPRPRRHQPRKPARLQRRLRLVEGGTREAERGRLPADRLPRQPHPPHHLVLDLHQVALVQERRLPERLVGDRLRPRVEAALRPQRLKLRILAPSRHRSSRQLMSNQLCRSDQTTSAAGPPPSSLQATARAVETPVRAAACTICGQPWPSLFRQNLPNTHGRISLTAPAPSPPTRRPSTSSTSASRSSTRSALRPLANATNG